MAATLQLTAKEDVTKTLFKLEQQNLRLIAQNKQLARVSGHATRQAKGGFDGVSRSIRGAIPSVGQLVTSLTGVGGVLGAVTTVKAAYAEWYGALDQLGTAHKKFARELTVDIATAGDTMHAAEISERLKEIPGLTEVQSRQVYAGVKEAVPWMGWKERMKLVEAAAPAAPVVSVSNLAEWGKIVGKTRHFTQDRSVAESVGLAWELQQAAGEKTSQLIADRTIRALGTLKKVGVKEEEAMSWNLAAMHAGLRSTSLIKIAEALDKEIKIIKPTPGHRVLTPAEKETNIYAAADRKERFQMLRSSKAVRETAMGAEAALDFSVIDFEYAKRLEKGLQAGRQPKNMLREIRVELAQSPEGLRTLQSHDFAVAAYKAARPIREKIATPYSAVKEAMAKDLESEKGALARFSVSLDQWFALRGSERPDEAYLGLLKRRRRVQRLSSEDSERLDKRIANWERFVENENRIRELLENQLENQGAKLDQIGAKLDQIEQNTRRSGEDTHKIETNTRGPRPAGVQENVIQHGEK